MATMRFTGLRRKIAALSVVALIVTLVKIAYEFHSAQHAINSPQRTGRIISPFLFYPYPHVTAKGGDRRSELFLRPGTHWTVSREMYNSHVARADTRIDTDNTHGIAHVLSGQGNATSLPVKNVLVSAFSSTWVSSKNKTLHPFLAIIVCSKPENTELRLAIRKSWGLDLDKSQVVLRFFIGQDDGWDDIIKREQTLHRDVIRTDYLETYENLSYKVLTAISWSLRSVRQLRYVMKIDDDTYVNLPHLLHELHNHSALRKSTQSYVMGAVCVDSPVVRQDGDKWFVSHLDYPSDVYPTYVFGGGYVMTRAAAEAVLAASLKMDYLHLEDVFITGILAQAGGVVHVSHAGFAFWTSKRPSPCAMVTGHRLTAVNMTSKQFYVMYSGIHAILRAGNWTKC